MQIALPRTVDAGKVSEQLQQRGQILHDLASNEIKKKQEQAQQAVIKAEKKDDLSFKDQSLQHQNGREQENKRKKQKESSEKIHPYKGKTIDYSG